MPTWILLALLWMAQPAGAAPFVPASDDTVLEHLPGRPDATLRAQRAALQRDPTQLPLALATAQQALLRARQLGDPRELGSAQAALAPWWSDADAPAPVRLLRATVLQSRHDFDAALAELDPLAEAPMRGDLTAALRAQALLTRASLLQLRGRFGDAAASCRAMQAPALAAAGPGARRAAEACLIELRSLTDDPRAAQRDLHALAGGAGAPPWLALVQAELAERLGDDDAAARHYRIAAQGGEVYALAAWADWLLDRDRAREALAVLAAGPDGADALRLRRALAWHRLGDPRAMPLAAALREAFDATRRRGDAPHLREEARLALELDGDPLRALALARAQWAVQREPADAVLLWRAAQAAGQPDAADALRDWLPSPASPAQADVRLAGLDTPEAP